MAGYALLADEDIELTAVTALQSRGHDVAHVPSVAELGQGADDAAVAAFSDRTDRTILTYDRDFLTTVSAEFHSCLVVGDGTAAPETVAAMVDVLATHVPQDTLSGARILGRDLLDYGDGGAPS
jgi:hypothetical protein